MKAYSYIRFSTPGQIHGDSLRRQLEATEKYAKENGLVIDTTIKDLGISAYRGANRTKGALGRFLNLISEGKIEKGSFLLVENLDRLSREEVDDALNQFISIIKAGITIVTLTDGMVYNQESIKNNWVQLVISIMIMARAHEELSRKAVNIKKAWKNKRSNLGESFKLTGKCPAWLIPIKEKISENRYKVINYEVIKPAAEVINQIFDMKLAGFGPERIARVLNQMESLNGQEVWMPKPRKRHLDDRTTETPPASWRGSYIVKLLHNNRELLGEYQPHVLTDGKRVPVGDPIPKYFPAIVSKDKYYRVQNLIKKNRETKGYAGGRNDKINNLFGNMAVCRECQSSMQYINKGDPPRGGRYLKCNKEIRKINGGCVSKAIKYNLVEEAVLTFCVGLSLSDVVQDNAGIESQIFELNKSLQHIAGQLSAIESRNKNLLDTIEKTTVPDVQKVLSNKLGQNILAIKSLEQQRNNIQSSMETLSRSTSTTEAQINGIKELIALMKDVKAEERYTIRLRLRSQLRQLIDKIWVFAEDEKLTIFFKTGQRRVIELAGGAPRKKMDAFPKSKNK